MACSDEKMDEMRQWYLKLADTDDEGNKFYTMHNICSWNNLKNYVVMCDGD